MLTQNVIGIKAGKLVGLSRTVLILLYRWLVNVWARRRRLSPKRAG